MDPTSSSRRGSGSLPHAPSAPSPPSTKLCAFASNKHSAPDDAYATESIGDDPLATSSGPKTWPSVEVHSLEHQAGINTFTFATFELPSKTLKARDEVAASLAPAVLEPQEEPQQKQDESQVEKDPFAASDVLFSVGELAACAYVFSDKAWWRDTTSATSSLNGRELTTGSKMKHFFQVLGWKKWILASNLKTTYILGMKNLIKSSKYNCFLFTLFFNCCNDAKTRRILPKLL